MLLLITYVLVALVFSFLCSIAEAVLLSVTTPYIALLVHNKKPAGVLLHKLKEDVNKPLAAVLTLNTIAHTVGAAGAGAQAAIVFGNDYVGVASAVLTLLILIFSEIIPKTIGAHYWRKLAPVTAYGLNFLIFSLYPFVKLSEKLTGSLTEGPSLKGFNREEFTVMADISAKEGKLAPQEFVTLKNLLLLRETIVDDVMTPRTVVFALPEKMTVGEFFIKYDHVRFSRIPVYKDNIDGINGFVLLNNLFLAQARGNTDSKLSNYRREIGVLLNSMSLTQAFDDFLRLRAHIMLTVDEYGGMVGIVTLEDILETLLGQEIIDEGDKCVDMRELARRQRKLRAKQMGLDIDQ